jgi:8-oxo-dGTP diphosphatase
MQKYTKLIEVVDPAHIDDVTYKRKMSCAVILTKERQILLQMRSQDRSSFPGFVTTFGGGVEVGETPMQALIRELKEELGASVNESEVISFGAITEAITNYTELLHVYFWHDHLGTITGCYEDQPLYFDNSESAILHPKIMDYVSWLLEQCKSRALLL